MNPNKKEGLSKKERDLADLDEARVWFQNKIAPKLLRKLGQGLYISGIIIQIGSNETTLIITANIHAKPYSERGKKAFSKPSVTLLIAKLTVSRDTYQYLDQEITCGCQIESMLMHSVEDA